MPSKWFFFIILLIFADPLLGADSEGKRRPSRQVSQAINNSDRNVANPKPVTQPQASGGRSLSQWFSNLLSKESRIPAGGTAPKPKAATATTSLLSAGVNSGQKHVTAGGAAPTHNQATSLSTIVIVPVKPHEPERKRVTADEAAQMPATAPASNLCSVRGQNGWVQAPLAGDTDTKTTLAVTYGRQHELTLEQLKSVFSEKWQTSAGVEEIANCFWRNFSVMSDNLFRKHVIERFLLPRLQELRDLKDADQQLLNGIAQQLNQDLAVMERDIQPLFLYPRDANEVIAAKKSAWRDFQKKHLLRPDRERFARLDHKAPLAVRYQGIIQRFKDELRKEPDNARNSFGFDDAAGQFYKECLGTLPHLFDRNWQRILIAKRDLDEDMLRTGEEYAVRFVTLFTRLNIGFKNQEIYEHCILPFAWDWKKTRHANFQRFSEALLSKARQVLQVEESVDLEMKQRLIAGIEQVPALTTSNATSLSEAKDGTTLQAPQVGDADAKTTLAVTSSHHYKLTLEELRYVLTKEWWTIGGANKFGIHFWRDLGRMKVDLFRKHLIERFLLPRVRKLMDSQAAYQQVLCGIGCELEGNLDAMRDSIKPLAPYPRDADDVIKAKRLAWKHFRKKDLPRPSDTFRRMFVQGASFEVRCQDSRQKFQDKLRQNPHYRYSFGLEEATGQFYGKLLGILPQLQELGVPKAPPEQTAADKDALRIKGEENAQQLVALFKNLDMGFGNRKIFKQCILPLVGNVEGLSPNFHIFSEALLAKAKSLLGIKSDDEKEQQK